LRLTPNDDSPEHIQTRSYLQSRKAGCMSQRARTTVRLILHPSEGYYQCFWTILYQVSNLYILSDTDLVVMTLSMENDEVDLNGLTSNDRFSEQMISPIDEVVRCWGTDPQERWDMIRSTFHPNLQQWESLLEPVEQCDEFTVVFEAAQMNFSYLYLPETAVESTRRIASVSAARAFQGRYICVLTRENMFLVIPEVNVRSGPAFLFSIYGQFYVPTFWFRKRYDSNTISFTLAEEQHSFSQNYQDVILRNHSDRICEGWWSAFQRSRWVRATPYRYTYCNFILPPVIPEAFKTNQLGFNGYYRTTLP
jgi:hypothetical protein